MLALGVVVILSAIALGSPMIAGTKPIVCKYKGKLYSDFKSDLIEIIISSLEPIKNRYNDIINDKEYLNNVLENGSKEASFIARKTISKVYRKVGFIQK